MENRLNSFYTGSKKVNVILSPNDSLALGLPRKTWRRRLQRREPSLPDPHWRNWRCEHQNTVLLRPLSPDARAIGRGDTRLLADQVAKMVFGDQIVVRKSSWTATV